MLIVEMLLSEWMIDRNSGLDFRKSCEVHLFGVELHGVLVVHSHLMLDNRVETISMTRILLLLY
jgi:hypothetical protein